MSYGTIGEQVSEQHSGDALFWLLTITSPELPEPLYLVNNNEPVVSLRIPYEPFPFEVILPPDDGGKPQNLVLKTYNLSSEFMDLIRQPIEPPKVQIDLVSSKNPDFIISTARRRVSGSRWSGATTGSHRERPRWIPTSALPSL